MLKFKNNYEIMTYRTKYYVKDTFKTILPYMKSYINILDLYYKIMVYHSKFIFHPILYPAFVSNIILTGLGMMSISINY